MIVELAGSRTAAGTGWPLTGPGIRQRQRASAPAGLPDAFPRLSGGKPRRSSRAASTSS
ncbi:hypothetical protein [Rhizobium yanglingense]